MLRKYCNSFSAKYVISLILITTLGNVNEYLFSTQSSTKLKDILYSCSIWKGVCYAGVHDLTCYDKTSRVLFLPVVALK